MYSVFFCYRDASNIYAEKSTIFKSSAVDLFQIFIHKVTIPPFSEINFALRITPKRCFVMYLRSAQYDKYLRATGTDNGSAFMVTSAHWNVRI